jgi:hypothetical protein
MCGLYLLAEQWAYRLIKVELDGQVTVYFPAPNDAAVSKYARCGLRDREWIKAASTPAWSPLRSSIAGFARQTFSMRLSASAP